MRRTARHGHVYGVAVGERAQLLERLELLDRGCRESAEVTQERAAIGVDAEVPVDRKSARNVLYAAGVSIARVGDGGAAEIESPPARVEHDLDHVRIADVLRIGDGMACRCDVRIAPGTERAREIGDQAGLDEGDASLSFSGVEASLEHGLWIEVVAAGVLAACGALLVLHGRGADKGKA